MEELELRDNQFKEVPCLAAFTRLRYLELSYNEIRSLAPLSSLTAPHLTELYAASNKVTTIEGLSQLASLRLLELGSNRIRAVEGLGALTCLRELWLGRNRIAELGEGLVPLASCLRRLSLQSNRLVSLAGLEACTALEELYLSHNGIDSLAGVDGLVNLRILDVANNRLTSLEGVGGLQQLTDLWANDNQIGSLDDVESALAAQRPTLSCLYLKGNPCAGGNDYRLRMQHLMPQLEQLDDLPIAK